MMQDQDTPNDKLKSKNIDICGKSRQYGEHILRTICFFYATTSLRDYFLRAFKSPEFGFRPHAEFTSNEALINWLIDTHSTDSPVLGYMNYLLHEVSENISKDGFNFHFEKTNIEFYPEDIFLQTKELNKNINSQLHYPPPEDVRQTASNINKSVSDLLLSIRKIWEDDIIPRTIILRKVSKDDLRDVFNQYDGFDQDDNEVKIIECPEDLPLRKPILIVSETNPSIINFKYCSCPEELIFR